MTVKAKVRNRKTGVNVEVNIKNENNQQSKNKYIPELQSNTDDPEPPSQAPIQNIIPYFNKAPSLPMYNNEGLGIPSRYGAAATQPQGNTEIPTQYNPDVVSQQLAPNDDNNVQDLAPDVIKQERGSFNQTDSIMNQALGIGSGGVDESEFEDSGPMSQDEVNSPAAGSRSPGHHVDIPPVALSDWTRDQIVRFSNMSYNRQIRFIELFEKYKIQLEHSFTNSIHKLSQHLITKYGLWGILSRAYHSNAITDPRSIEHYEMMLRKKYGLN